MSQSLVPELCHQPHPAAARALDHSISLIADQLATRIVMELFGPSSAFTDVQPDVDSRLAGLSMEDGR